MSVLIFTLLWTIFYSQWTRPTEIHNFQNRSISGSDNKDRSTRPSYLLSSDKRPHQTTHYAFFESSYRGGWVRCKRVDDRFTLISRAWLLLRLDSFPSMLNFLSSCVIRILQRVVLIILIPRWHRSHKHVCWFLYSPLLVDKDWSRICSEFHNFIQICWITKILLEKFTLKARI